MQDISPPLGEADKFQTMSFDERMKSYFGGLEIINIGEPFRSKAYRRSLTSLGNLLQLRENKILQVVTQEVE